MSHTTKMKVKFKDKAILAKAIEAIGGKVLGEGIHRLYGGKEQGFGFNLPGWTYPLILKDETLAPRKFASQFR